MLMHFRMSVFYWTNESTDTVHVCKFLLKERSQSVFTILPELAYQSTIK